MSSITNDTRNFNLQSYKIKPNITKYHLTNKLNELNSYVDWTVIYSNGSTLVSDISNIEYQNDGTYKLSTKWIKGKVKEIAKTYRKVEKSKNKNKKGKKTKLNNKSSKGIRVDVEKEVEDLKFLFTRQGGISNVYNRIPCFL